MNLQKSIKLANNMDLSSSNYDCRDNNEHRRCITASLVKGTYVLESDRTKNRENTSHAPASAWWEAFHFRKLPEYKFERARKCAMWEIRRILGGKLFIYGAVFEYAPPDGVRRHPSAPSHIVAFRGTMTRDPTVLSDMLQDFRILINKQHACGRFTNARENVQRLLREKPDNNGRGEIWLAGHSLGASVALDVGREMVTRKGCNLPTFLFNPPHVSAAPLVDAVMPEEAKRDLYISSYDLKGVLGMTVLRSHRKHMEELFQQLSPWVPNLYVHRKDIICKGFIDYFEQREQVQEWSTRVANSAAATLLYRDLLFRQQSEWPQLLPCAVLWISNGDDPHGLQQWWQPTGPELGLRRNEYSWSLI
jgi:hypothetical protein